jgi:hypothetical protein
MDPKKRPRNTKDNLPRKRVRYIFDDDERCFISETDSDFLSSDSSSSSDDEKELIIIDKKINNLDDLIELGKLYDETKRYNIDMKLLNKLADPLTELNSMIGMETVKQDMIDHILFRIQNLDNENKDMMHTVIQGPPGVGKTEVAKIIGKIYLAMGILKNDKFIKATRSDLIAGYLGQTAKATQKVIDSAQGGVLFIDEVYSLGNAEKRDSFAKECIDTINENLTEKKTEFICIIAGYKEEIDKCFFAFNPGLERRFPIRFTIEEYKFEDLFLIFQKKVTDSGWLLDESVTNKFFKKKMSSFKYFGGDMEVLFTRCKRAHSRRIFCTEEVKKSINLDDLKKGYEIFKIHQNKKDLDFMKSMFL